MIKTIRKIMITIMISIRILSVLFRLLLLIIIRRIIMIMIMTNNRTSDYQGINVVLIVSDD